MSDTQAVRAREAVVEQMARASYESQYPLASSWSSLHDSVREGWRRDERVSLTALLTSPQLVDVLVEAGVLEQVGWTDRDALAFTGRMDAHRETFGVPLFRVPSRSTPTDE